MVPTTANGKLISAVFLKVRLHTAINRDDFVSWCMLYNNNNNLLLLLTEVFFSGVLQKLCTIQCDTIRDTISFFQCSFLQLVSLEKS